MRKKLIHYLDLTSELNNHEEIHQSITHGVIFKGTNLWVLVFAIIIASVGLNTNSTAVIIGAMLISPLMGPINGMGYAIATYDFTLFRRAAKNFGFAVGASLATSTLYFLITPISTAHSELLARTSPTIFDVLIALFGGLAGIVAISSKHKGNVIPGVAIATALMPPLCTAGFGLATAQWNYFFGAFYLFTINTVFIGISSVLFSQVLNFPIRTLIEPAQKRRVNRSISLVTALTIIPSVYFGYVLVEKEKFTSKSSSFIASVGVVEGSYLLRHEVSHANKTMKLIYGGNNLSDKERIQIVNQARDFGPEDIDISFEEAFSLNTVNENISELDEGLRAELNRLQVEIRKNRSRHDSITNMPSLGKQLFMEIKPIFPEVTSLSYARAVEYFLNDGATRSKVDTMNVSLISIGLAEKSMSKNDELKLRRWLKARLNAKDSVRVLMNVMD